MRYWEYITLKEFKKKIQEAIIKEPYDFDGDYNRLTPQIEKDLSKVEFDSENIDAEKIKTLSNGMYYLGVFAGGDWEQSVFFVIYWDGNKLRGYIPKEGNLWNTDTKIAYGNNDEADLKNYKKRWPKYFKNMPIEDFDVCSGHDMHDMKEMKADIMSRIVKKLEK